MELKYIWIKEYNNIKEQGFNFCHSGNDNFLYDGENLQINPKSQTLINFGENIHSLTAIAGQNGSGKSSLCQIILEAIATNTNGIMSYNIKFEGIVCIDKYICYHKDLKINSADLEKLGYTIKIYEESPLISEEPPFNTFDKLGFIYYSNVLDNRSHFRNISLENLSTEYLLGNSYPKMPKEDNFLIPYMKNEAYRVTNFYLNFTEECPFSGPDEIRIAPNYSGENVFLNIDYYKDEHKHAKYLSEYESNLLAYISYSRFITKENYSEEIILNEDELKNKIRSLYRLNIFTILNKGKLPEKNESIKEYILEKGSSKGLFVASEKVDEILSIFDKLLALGEVQVKFKRSNYGRSDESNEWRHHLFNFVLDNSEETRYLLKELIKLEEEVFRADREVFMRINDYYFQSKQSTGEYSFLLLFSRLFELLNRKKDNIDLIEEYIVLLDEPEIGYHPAWKKKFLKWLLNFLNSKFHNYKFQLIITTHSPYLLSDLPSENIILLKKDKDNNCAIQESSKFQTFGANIHTLLSDSFFLKDGLIGDFAKDKISDLIDYLKSEDNSKNRNNEAQKVIDIIGEPILQNKLQQMLTNKRSIDEKLKWHQAEIEKLMNSK